MKILKILCIFSIIYLSVVWFAKSEKDDDLLLKTYRSKKNHQEFNRGEIPLNAYVVKHVQEHDTYLDLRVEYSGDETYFIKKENYIYKELSVKIQYLTRREFFIKINQVGGRKWELPERFPFPNDEEISYQRYADFEYDIQYTKKPFTLKVQRKGYNETLFDTSDSYFILSDYYIELSTVVPTKNIFGFGERASKFRLDPGTYTLWNKDQPETRDNGTSGNQLSGYHPMYLFRENNGKFSIILLRSTRPMDITIKHNVNNNSITIQKVGGGIHLRFFLGTNRPERVIRNYHAYLRGWQEPPFWAMGFQQGRWGYKNIHSVKDVIQKYDQLSIPIDGFWTSRDVMNSNQDFTFDTMRFNIGEFNDLLRSESLQFVSNINFGIAVDDMYFAYKLGKKRNVFLKSKETGQLLYGLTWAGLSHFVDLLHPNATKYYFQVLEQQFAKVPFHGIWLSDNEPSQLIDGELDPEELNTCDTAHCYHDQNFKTKQSTIVDKIPYIPGNNPLDEKTLSINAVHYGNITELEFHNFVGFMQTFIANEFFRYIENINFPVVFSRSTAYGSGRWGFHWTGSNAATWEYFRDSIPQIFNLNLFGIPFTGANICGYTRNATAELCARWIQLGALYPVAKMDNMFNSNDKELFAFGDLVLETAREALQMRYSLLKYYYSLFIQSNGTGTIFRPLFFEFPDDPIVYEDKVMNEQFLLGKDLMVTPILYEGTNTTRAYFPASVWYRLYTGEVIYGPSWQEIVNELPERIHMHIKEGSIVQFQNVGGITRTWQLDQKYGLIIALHEDNDLDKQYAQGHILAVSDHLSEEKVFDQCILTECQVNVYAEVDSSNKSILRISFQSLDPRTKFNKSWILQKITVYGWNTYITETTNVTVLYNSLDGVVTNVQREDLHIFPNEHRVKIKIEDLYIETGGFIEVNLT